MLNLRKYLPLLLLYGCVPAGSPTQSGSGKTLLYENHDYEGIVGQVQLYPEISNNSYSELENPVINPTLRTPLKLKFDLFLENFTPVTVRYIHCQADWRPSNLAEIRFLDNYNEFPVDGFEYSANTKIPYVAYSIQLQPPTQPGNYILCAYRGYDKSDILFTRRLLVVGDEVGIQSQLKMTTSVANRWTNQQINFSIDYSRIASPINPLRDLSVVILQNHNWNRAIKNLTPTLIRQDQSYLEYNHFNDENTLPAGNEFRFFDLRAIDYRGQNVGVIKKEENRVIATILKDKSRKNTAYSQLNNDLNGGYYLENRDPGDSQLMSEYVWTFFKLEEEPVTGSVYITGKFNNWNLEDFNKMEYDTASGGYIGKLLLKQGYYNYSYTVVSPYESVNFFEGDFNRSTNDYEIIVYLRDPATNIDRIAGYKSFSGSL